MDGKKKKKEPLLAPHIATTTLRYSVQEAAADRGHKQQLVVMSSFRFVLGKLAM